MRHLATAARHSLHLAAAPLCLVCAVIAEATWLSTHHVVTALTATITALAGRDQAASMPPKPPQGPGRMAQANEILRCNDLTFNALTERAARKQALNQQRTEQIGQLREDFQKATRTTIEAARAGETGEMTQSAALLRHDAERLTQRISTFLGRVRAA